MNEEKAIALGKQAADLEFGNAGLWNGAINPDINMKKLKTLGRIEKYALVDAYISKVHVRLRHALGLEK
jgi:hypothetical protein